MRIRRVNRERPQGAHDVEPAAEYEVELRPGELTGAFAPPPWLRDLGGVAWLLVRGALTLVGAVWLLSLTSTIVVPVVTASIIAAVLSPLVAFLQRHGLPRIAGTAIVFVTVIVAALLMIWLVVGGITSQAGALESALKSGANKLQSSLQDLG